jgi:hypothetical protein
MRRLFSTGGGLFVVMSAGILAGSAFPTPLLAADQVAHRIIEGVPMRIVNQRKAKRDRLLDALKNAPVSAPASRYMVIFDKRKWRAGKTLTVAFNGGSTSLHAEIAQVASEWARYGNIELDFGFNQVTGKYRRWGTTDSDYAADIRISFHDPEGGYWSVVGTESRDASIVKPGQASMNLEGFDTERPDGWEGIVRHEFGHALGLEHEHQHPQEGCDKEWRWDDDPGYIPTVDSLKQFVVDRNGRYPGVYRVLSGPPNKWPKARVDNNLRQLANSSAYRFGRFDKLSVMQYSFDQWMFKKGSRSPCYSAASNDDFSAEDKLRFAEFYPGEQLVTESDTTKLREEINTLKLHSFTSQYLRRQLDAVDIHLK